MEIYTLEASGYNDGEYEDFWNFDKFYGVFSTIEKAKEYAEKLMERSRKNTMEVEKWSEDGRTPLSYYETFKVIEDWNESDGIFFKEVSYGEDYTHVINEIYRISKVTVDPEFKAED